MCPFFHLVEKLMELELLGMREGELSTMKVRSWWSPGASPGLSFTGTAKPGMWSQRSPATLRVRERRLLNARKVETGGGSSLSGMYRQES